MTTEMCSNVLERPQHCCSKCKGLFTFQDERLKHQLTCTANPFKSPCTYFACERKIFLQLFQPEDFQMEDRLKTTPDMLSAIYSESEVLTFVNRRPKELTVNGGSEFLTCVNGGSDVLTTVKSGSEVLTSVNSGSEVFTHENSGSEILTQVNGWSESLTQVNGGSDILTPENGGSEVLTRVTSQSEVLTCVNGGSEVPTYVNGGLETGHIADEAAEDGQLEDGNEEDLATKLLSCNACGFKTDNKNKYYNHLLKHRGVVYRCMYQGCSFKSIYKRNYDYHVRIKHTEKTIYQCENCSYNTCEKNSLNRHVQHQHLREMRYKCADCDFTALFRIDVVKHVRNTHIQLKVYACNQCEFRTCYPHVLKYHLMAHGGIRPYKCSACEYQVNNPGQVRRHIQTVHPDRHDVKCENLDLSFEIDARQFKCAENVSDKDIKVIELTKEEIEEVRKMQAEEEAKGKVLRPRGRKPAKFLGISRTSDRVERDTDILNGNSHEVNDNDVALLGYCTALDDDAPDVNGNADVNENLQGIA
ncbi:RESTB-like protein [Mya arenaria]|uniref:RESTB-like protein n=1 Tax=Mya arenaria TaxID=6604 RepID=A0ABY7DU54_MYAAR|nr:RESTB-like protein [Mya arenaria]